jgi:hypothetical protein
VERLSAEDIGGGYDYSGEYATPEDTVRANVTRYGVMAVCRLHKGWFSHTIANKPLSHPVATVFIDCDVAKGTLEVFSGVIPSLSADGIVFSQDYHIAPVRNALTDYRTWRGLRVEPPMVRQLTRRLAALSFARPENATSTSD